MRWRTVSFQRHSCAGVASASDLVPGPRQQRGVVGQLGVAVPAEPVGDGGAHARRLRVVEVGVAVEPPVDDLRPLVVAEAQRAAAAEQQRRGEQRTDNPRLAEDRMAGTAKDTRHRHHGRGQGHPHEVGAAEGAAPAGGREPIAACARYRSRPRGRAAWSSSPATAPSRSRPRCTRAAALRFVRQEPQLGTGHAVQQAVPLLPDEGITLILNGDVPLIEADTARALVAACAGSRLALLTIELADAERLRPRRARRCRRARRERAGASTPSSSTRTRRRPQRAIREVYTGMMARADRAAQALARRGSRTTTRRASTT